MRNTLGKPLTHVPHTYHRELRCRSWVWIHITGMDTLPHFVITCILRAFAIHPHGWVDLFRVEGGGVRFSPWARPLSQRKPWSSHMFEHGYSLLSFPLKMLNTSFSLRLLAAESLLISMTRYLNLHGGHRLSFACDGWWPTCDFQPQTINYTLCFGTSATPCKNHVHISQISTLIFFVINDTSALWPLQVALICTVSYEESLHFLTVSVWKHVEHAYSTHRTSDGCTRLAFHRWTKSKPPATRRLTRISPFRRSMSSHRCLSANAVMSYKHHVKEIGALLI